MRKIIQICESSIAGNACGDSWNLSALCDDGSVWIISGINDSQGSQCQWQRLPDVPQDALGDKHG